MATDRQRVEAIYAKDYNDAQTAVQKMCKLIKKPEKAWNRYKVCIEMGHTRNDHIAREFFDCAVDLKHPRALAFKAVFRARSDHHRELVLKIKQKALMPVAEKLANQIEKRTDASTRVSTMCSHAYWNNDGLFISLSNLGDDTPYQGYSPGGPESIATYRRSYLGKTLAKVATVVRNNNASLFKDHSNFFVFMAFPK